MLHSPTIRYRITPLTKQHHLNVNIYRYLDELWGYYWINPSPNTHIVELDFKQESQSPQFMMGRNGLSWHPFQWSRFVMKWKTIIFGIPLLAK